MTYGRRHYITQQILVRLAYAGPTSGETREFLKATMRFLVAVTLGFLTLAAVASGAELQEEASSAGEFRYRRGLAEALEVAPMIETRVRFDVTGVIARATVVQRFRNPLDAWVLSDIRLSFDGEAAEQAEVWPDRIPDLYLGEPLVVGARFEQPPAAIRVSGERDGQPFSTVVPLDEARSGVGINVLWARRKIQSLLDGIHEGDDAEAVRAQVVSLGLTHHLVTDHTSLVAVDVTPSRPIDEGLERVEIPLNSPHGSLGSLPQTATPAAFFLLEGLSATVAALVLLAASRR